MAITTGDGYLAAAKQKVRFVKTQTATTVAAQWHTLLDRNGNPGAGSLTISNTANGVVPTDATAGFPTVNARAGRPGTCCGSCSGRSPGRGSLVSSGSQQRGEWLSRRASGPQVRRPGWRPHGSPTGQQRVQPGSPAGLLPGTSPAWQVPRWPACQLGRGRAVALWCSLGRVGACTRR